MLDEPASREDDGDPAEANVVAPDEQPGHGFVASHVRSASARLGDRARAYENVPLIGIGIAIYRRDKESSGSMVGSAIAFRLFLFFVPLLLLVVGVAGVAGPYADPQSVSKTTGVSGGLANQIRAAFTQSGRAPWGLIVLGLFGIVWTGRSLSRVLEAASAAAWRLRVDERASWRIVGSVAGLLAGMGLVAILVNKARVELGLGVAGLSLGPAFAAYAVAWLIVSARLPRGTEDPGALLPGATLMASVIVAMHAVSQFYLPGRFERASQLYGAIGATVVTLGWFFIVGRAVVVAAEMNSVIYDRYGSVSTLVFGLPMLRIIAARSARLRRFFDLDDERGTPPRVSHDALR